MWKRFLFLTLLIFSIAAFMGCSSDSGDDDDSTPQVDDDATDDDSAPVDDDTTSDDDDTTPTDDDTGDDDDDTTPTGDPPVIKAVYFYLWPLEFTSATNEITGSKKFNPATEGAGVYMEYSDKDCDLVGGKIWANLDETGYEEATTLPNNVNCSSDKSHLLMGFDLTGKYAASGSHKLQIKWTDAAGNESAVKSVFYTAGSWDHAIGTSMDDWTLNDKDGNPVSLSDLLPDADPPATQCLWLQIFTAWCPTCNTEAGALESVYTTYISNGLKIAGIMIENNAGNSPTGSDLQDWITLHSLTYLVLADPGAAATGEYFINNYVPFNIILDEDRIIRAFLTGWDGGVADTIVKKILGI